MRFRTARTPRLSPDRRHLGPLLVIACLAVGSAAHADAQTYFKWTDSQGVVHFSDAPPPAAKGLEKLDLPAAAAPPRAANPAAALPGAGAPGTPPQGAEEPPSTARVILTSRKMPRTGPSALHITGEVKNVGGGSARDVLVTVTAIDANSGDECFREDIPVQPSSLGSGDAGTFDAEFDHPCFFGRPKLEVTPVWVSVDRAG